MNNSNRFQNLGWAAALLLLGVLVGSGFQAPSNKVGVVDISRLIESSEFGKQNQETFAAMRTAREELLRFIDDNRVLTNEQASRIRELWLKPNPTAEERAELERLRAEVVASNRRWQELSTKPNLTAEERTLVEEYARRSQTMNEVAQRWFREFTSEMQVWADRQKLTSIERARRAIQETARAQGYSYILEIGVAPYGANDITDPSLAALNTQSP